MATITSCTETFNDLGQETLLCFTTTVADLLNEPTIGVITPPLQTSSSPEGNEEDSVGPTIVRSGDTVAKTIVTSLATSQNINVALPSQTNTADGDFPTGANVAATSPAVASASSGGSDGVSKGAVAGIAIATAIIGAAIAFIVAFILFKHRKRSSHQVYGSMPEYTALSKGGPTPYVQVSHVPPPTSAAAIIPATQITPSPDSLAPDFAASILPPPADDRMVSSRASVLFGQIQAHVENFYRDVHASITPSMEGDLARFGAGNMEMIELLQSSSSPTYAIKHALTSYVLTITSPEGDEESTLFPPQIAGVKKKEQFSNSDLSAAYILYRRLAVHLHSSGSSSGTQARLLDIREAAEHFSITFFPWANPEYGDQEKDEDLVRIISDALDLQIWLYGQPFAYEFLWESIGGRGLVVVPGVEVTHNAIQLGIVYMIDDWLDAEARHKLCT
ncbi:hypothetical protein CC78DRAFT_569831 [Lojkania enalia]|uniref:Uncharacterized protein n=1 Tax=Lojkania enalia TaxID=147567 RepID=A0A9P4K9A8_9PLEO|nr:hypothetical protein CC78DRAFT_569831 [Didymosphaeria enalia]